MIISALIIAALVLFTAWDSAETRLGDVSTRTDETQKLGPKLNAWRGQRRANADSMNIEDPYVRERKRADGRSLTCVERDRETCFFWVRNIGCCHAVKRGHDDSLTHCDKLKNTPQKQGEEKQSRSW